jgi:rhomboid family GlyGly-CTERM serine protease
MMRSRMISAGSLREFFAGYEVPLALAVSIAALALGGERVADALAYRREALAAGQWWRALTGHFVHLGAMHAAINLAGLLALVLLCPRKPGVFEWLRRVGLLALAISASLYVAAPTVDGYVGFSGVLHGLFVLGLAPMARSGDRIAVIGLGLLIVKILLEQMLGPSAEEERLIGGNVVTLAHLFGTLAALVYGFAFGTFRRGETPQ